MNSFFFSVEAILGETPKPKKKIPKKVFDKERTHNVNSKTEKEKVKSAAETKNSKQTKKLNDSFNVTDATNFIQNTLKKQKPICDSKQKQSGSVETVTSKIQNALKEAKSKKTKKEDKLSKGK